VAIEFQAGEGHLQPGKHEATVEEVKEKLVDPYAESSTRTPIFAQWLGLRTAMREIVPFEKQWLNGSFVSTKLNPADLDVATFVDGEAVEALGDDGRSALNALCGGSDTEEFPLCDSFLIVRYPEGHPMASLSRVIEETFEQSFYGFDDRLNLAKGFVEVVG
jgi:hypothetical protein